LWCFLFVIMNYVFFGLVICFTHTTWFSHFTQITSFKNHFSPLCGKKHATSPMLKISLYHLQFHFYPLASGLGFEAQKNLSFVIFQKTQMKNSYPSYFEFKTMLCNMFHNFWGQYWIALKQWQKIHHFLICYSFGSFYWHSPSKTNTIPPYPNIGYRTIFVAMFFFVVFLYYILENNTEQIVTS
jgi:hypothetical protein